MLFKINRTLSLYYVFFILAFFISSCGGGKYATENRLLKEKVADLELRIYELTESPTHLLDEVLEDVQLLMSVPSEANLNLALDLISGYASSYPTSESLYRLNSKKIEINILLANGGYANSKIGSLEKSKKDNLPKVKLKFSVTLIERSTGFVNIELRVQNLSPNIIANLWLKGIALDANGKSYGMTQDFFFNRLEAYDVKEEVLSWEYVQADQVKGIRLSQIRLSQNRNNRLLTQEECLVGDGNVKIFLDF